jgi:Fe-S cluster assembly iron-binding protein IscA
MNILEEIDRQNLSDISGWHYVEDNMPIAADYIIKKCTGEHLNLCDFVSRETDQSRNIKVRLIVKKEGDPDESAPLSIEEITENSHKISSSSMQAYLDKLSDSLARDLQVQFILKDLDKRTQQIRDAAIPDTQKLSLVQRYRTADERQFSKTLGELLELQKRRQSV